MTRIFDILLSLAGMIVLFPLMVPVMIALKLSGEHRVFYLQRRVGRHGKEFRILKFATMLQDSPSMPGAFVTQKDDPRVLPLGRALRKTKINELPQLANVLLGQMSLVGPRPLVAEHLLAYAAEARAAVLRQRPGVTGLASLVFRDEEAVLDRMPGDRTRNHDLVVAPYKGELEKWHAENRSVGLYFSILFRTAVRVLFPGALAGLPPYRGLPQAPAALAPHLDARTAGSAELRNDG
ncbi:MAG: sugar transferase [Spirochaetales bacterium]|nr:sugar transferase [Spirochaetales bacterium]